MGHTIYYRVEILDWEGFRKFIARTCEGLGFRIIMENESVLILPECSGTEPLEIMRNGEGFVKTNLVEPCHSIFLLILHSVSSFGSVEMWED
ncbi:TonB-dependent receptor [Thermococcus sp. MV11]|uniref:TonB-dependent receptor n=1 Tax=Thermococcus sp. MV11 TaxID=1638267 RepID=UPI0014318565|nr:TonB-dependent receptor [Thermococcus sp. MV11]NJE03782.1 TonB-dependent receptor [Thermococcus sp. MV11]